METIHIAHSPDSDDAFMFYALATGKVKSSEFEFVHVLQDIETLNRAALQSRYEVTAVSIHAYAYLAEHYALLNSGASMGEGYGPVLVSRESFSSQELSGKRVAIPGKWTSAYLALKLFEPEFQEKVVAFDRILEAVQRKEVDAGLVIHEGQLSYHEAGLRKVLDLGEWWQQATALPLPLGGNIVRRDLGARKIGEISKILTRSIEYALSHRQQALEYSLQFGRGLDSDQGNRFVSMYVNQRTLDYGEEGRRAVQLFLDRGFEQGIIPHRVTVDFI